MSQKTAQAPSSSTETLSERAASVSRRGFLQGAGALIAAGAARPATAAATQDPRIGGPSGGRALPTKPNILILIADQERAPQHWPAGWGAANLPNRQRLADHGLTFTQACCNAGMCSPSRATLFTGLYPATHGVVFTLTFGGTHAALEPNLPLDIQNMGKMLASAGYNVQYRGKWHISRGADMGDPTPEDLASYGFNGWVPPEAGENSDPAGFGGGCTAWDAVYTQQAVDFLTSEAAANTQPWALIVSLVNPHDVLAYPRTWDEEEEGGCTNYAPYAPDCFAQGIELPPTIDEDLANNYKPTAHQQTQVFLNVGLGPLLTDFERRRYVNFYAYLQKVVDEHLGSVLDALETQPAVRDKTVVMHFADHGELGLSHGGLRQKMFNAYEENLRIPLVLSHPAAFPAPVQTPALASLIDLMPTIATMAGVANRSAWTFMGKDLMPIINDAIQNPGNPTVTVQENTLYTFDDETAGAENGQSIVTQPNHIRCLREARWKYAIYFDPNGVASAQYELYDLENDPFEEHNCANPANTLHYNPEQVAVMHAKILAKMVETNTLPFRAWLPVVNR